MCVFKVKGCAAGETQPHVIVDKVAYSVKRCLGILYGWSLHCQSFVTLRSKAWSLWLLRNLTSCELRGASVSAAHLYPSSNTLWFCVIRNMFEKLKWETIRGRKVHGPYISHMETLEFPLVSKTSIPMSKTIRLLSSHAGVVQVFHCFHLPRLLVVYAELTAVTFS